jgi:nicotinamidase-related amidase
MHEILYRLAPEKTALLVVDIQNRLMPVIHGREEVERNSVLLIKAANALNIPVIATTQYSARIGELLPEISAELGNVKPVDKMEFDCFRNEMAAEAVRVLGRDYDTLIVCGVETHICIYQTVIGALMSGYRVWVPADAVSSRSPKNYESGLSRIRDIGAVVANTEMIIYELLQRAGTAVFKELLPFLK